eukprot:105280-Pleurochrysis_carterae.AAC.1
MCARGRFLIDRTLFICRPSPALSSARLAAAARSYRFTTRSVHSGYVRLLHPQSTAQLAACLDSQKAPPSRSPEQETAGEEASTRAVMRARAVPPVCLPSCAGILEGRVHLRRAERRTRKS